MNMRKVYFIRHIPSGQWYESWRGNHFKKDLNEAAIFHQRANAEKQIRSILQNFIKHNQPGWLNLEDKKYQSNPITENTRSELEVVEFGLVELTEDGEIL